MPNENGDVSNCNAEFSANGRVPSAERLWRLAWLRLQEIEKHWDDRPRRLTLLQRARAWLSSSGEPRLTELTRFLTDGITGRQLLDAMVPLEREVERSRISDIEILRHDKTKPGAHRGNMPLVVVADCLRSAFNVGGLFRTAEAFGAAAIWLSGYSATPDQPRVAEAALGAQKALAWRSFGRLAEALEELRSESYRIAALETVEGAVAVQDYAWEFPTAIILGNERFGLEAGTLERADICLRIPLYGMKNSLNVVSAAAIALHSARTAFDSM